MRAQGVDERMINIHYYTPCNKIERGRVGVILESQCQSVPFICPVCVSGFCSDDMLMSTCIWVVSKVVYHIYRQNQKWPTLFFSHITSTGSGKTSGL